VFESHPRYWLLREEPPTPRGQRFLSYMPQPADHGSGREVSSAEQHRAALIVHLHVADHPERDDVTPEFWIHHPSSRRLP
jgi:hypothetical protein